MSGSADEAKDRRRKLRRLLRDSTSLCFAKNIIEESFSRLAFKIDENAFTCVAISASTTTSGRPCMLSRTVEVDANSLDNEFWAGFWTAAVLPLVPFVL